MTKKYIVTLTEEERASLQAMIAAGKRAARTLAHARILLKADARTGWEDAAISQAVEVSMATVQRVRQRFVEEGLEAALHPRPRPRTRLPLIDGVAEAQLITLACSQPPEGAGRWTLRLLAEKMVELAYVAHVSHETVRQVLKKRNEALAGRGMVSATRGERGVRLCDGRRARSLYATLRSGLSAGLHG